MRVLWATLVVVVLDQLTKAWVVAMMEIGDTIPVIGQWFRLSYFQNPGFAFGWTLGSKLLLSIVSVLATAMVAVYLVWLREASRTYRLALALILGGAIGNLIDRVFAGVVYGYAPLGYGNVIDFLHLDVYHGFVDLPWRTYPTFVALFPVSNIADVAIIVGLVLVLAAHIALGRQERAEQRAASVAEASLAGAGRDAADLAGAPEHPEASA
ncbi:MAG: signal peptidase II [Bacteroidota bacterium]